MEELIEVVEEIAAQYSNASDCSEDYEKEQMPRLKLIAAKSVVKLLKGEDKEAVLNEFKGNAKELEEEFRYGFIKEE